MRDHRNAKAMAKTLRETLALRGVEIPHGAALEIVARQFGLPSWNVLAARIEAAPGPAAPAPIAFGPAVPILRIFDVEKTREFYLGFLGFAVDWEHRYGDNFPLYCQVSRAGLGLHLSEHAGDASPGEHVRLHDREIEWAQFGKSFNTHVNRTLLEKLPRDGLTGKTLTATGAWPLPAKGQLPQFVPVTIAIGG